MPRLQIFIPKVQKYEYVKNRVTRSDTLLLPSNDKIVTFTKLTSVKCPCGRRRIVSEALCWSSFDGMSVPPSDAVAEPSL